MGDVWSRRRILRLLAFKTGFYIHVATQIPPNDPMLKIPPPSVIEPAPHPAEQL